MKRATLLLLFLLPGVSATVLHAQTGNELIVECGDAVKLGDSDAVNSMTKVDFGRGMHCLGMADGAWAAAVLWQTADKALKNHVSAVRPCLPDAFIPPIQVARIVLKWLQDHPERLQLPAEVLVLMALHDAFPCRQ